MNDSTRESDLHDSKVPASIGDLARLADAITDGIKKAFSKCDARIAALEERLADISAMEYLGVHELGKSYRKNQFVTHEGSIWAARCATAQRPGDGNDWQLAVKKGRDLR